MGVNIFGEREEESGQDEDLLRGYLGTLLLKVER